MARAEFSKKVKLAAFKRVEGRCESCLAPIVNGAEYDHIVPHAVGGDNSLENVQVLCRPCHADKTRKRDVPQIAKSKRIAEKRAGVRRKGPAMAGSRRSQWKRKMNGQVERRT